MADEIEATDTAAGGDDQQQATAADTDTSSQPGGGSDDPGNTGNADGNADAPESYADFDLPDGVEMNADALDRATAVFKEMGLTQEQAQQYVTLHAESVKAAQESQVESFNQMKAGWLEQAKGDAEIGGEKFDENVATAKTFLSKFGTPELTALLDETGVGNHPEIIRAFARAGALMNEDSPAGNGGNVQEKKDRVSVLYGNS